MKPEISLAEAFAMLGLEPRSGTYGSEPDLRDSFWRLNPDLWQEKPGLKPIDEEDLNRLVEAWKIVGAYFRTVQTPSSVAESAAQPKPMSASQPRSTKLGNP